MTSKELELSKKLFLAGLGIAAIGKEKIEGIVNELVQKGDVSKKDADDILARLIKKGEKAQKELQALVKQEITKVMDEIGIATKKDIEALEKKIKAMEK
jgi:polyhydroxyalkanoate synthesis regulator phasin